MNKELRKIQMSHARKVGLVSVLLRRQIIDRSLAMFMLKDARGCYQTWCFLKGI